MKEPEFKLRHDTETERGIQRTGLGLIPKYISLLVFLGIKRKGMSRQKSGQNPYENR